MSRYYYIASDTVLPEQANPHVKQLSINEAINLGIDVDLSLFNKNMDRDLPNVILFIEDETDYEYPNVYLIDRKGLDNDIKTSKKFCAVLEWHYSESSVEIVMNYIKSQMKTASEVELWSVWLGNHGSLSNTPKEQCDVNNLTNRHLEKFCNSDLDAYCLTVVR